MRQQILPVLNYIRANVNRGLPLLEACHTAINARHKEVGVTYQTIEDGCRRRLGLAHVGEFHKLVASWLENGSSELKNLLLGRSEVSVHSEIQQFFEETNTLSHRLSMRSPSTKNSGETVASSTGPCTITMDQLEPETLAALRERARMSGQSLETEIKSILAQAARAGRSELATWSAGLRGRLRNRYVGDVTADIRSDRQR